MNFFHYLSDFTICYMFFLLTTAKSGLLTKIHLMKLPRSHSREAFPARACARYPPPPIRWSAVRCAWHLKHTHHADRPTKRNRFATYNGSRFRFLRSRQNGGSMFAGQTEDTSATSEQQVKESLECSFHPRTPYVDLHAENGSRKWTEVEVRPVLPVWM